MQIKFKKLHVDAVIPQYQTEGAAGFDFHAVIVSEEQQQIFPGQRVLIKTGLAVELPKGYELQIRSRSGLALKEGVIVLNAPGTIDADYRGEIGIILTNTDKLYTKVIKTGDRIAQGVIAKVEIPEIIELGIGESLSSTTRGEFGFGSTGK